MDSKNNPLNMDGLETIVGSYISDIDVNSAQRPNKIQPPLQRANSLQSTLVQLFSFKDFIDCGDEYDINILFRRLRKDNSSAPTFTIFQREKSTAETILQIAHALNVTSPNTLEITLEYDSIPGKYFCTNPYIGLKRVLFHSENDTCKLFDVEYKIGKGAEVTVQSKDYLQLVPLIFRTLNKRDIQENDFDSRLLDKIKQEPSGRVIGTNHVDSFYEFFPPPKEKEISEPIEKLEDSSAVKPSIVKQIYKEFDNHQHRNWTPERLCILFSNIGYSITALHKSPINPSPNTSPRIAATIYAILHPLKTARGILQDRTVVPNIDQIELAARINDLSKENISAVIAYMNHHTNCSVRMFPKKLTYGELLEINYEHKKLAHHLNGVEIKSENTAVTAFFNTKRTYQDIKKELSRTKHTPSYKDVPAHHIITDEDVMFQVKLNCNVVITTKNLFQYRPIYLKSGISTVNDTLKLMQDAINQLKYIDSMKH